MCVCVCVCVCVCMCTCVCVCEWCDSVLSGTNELLPVLSACSHIQSSSNKYRVRTQCVQACVDNYTISHVHCTYSTYMLGLHACT